MAQPYASRAVFLAAFYRLVGTVSTNDSLAENSEAADEVADLCLTNGIRRAQRFMLDSTYYGWVKRSAAITWSGTDATTGGRYVAVASDFLKLAGDEHRSSIVEANGDPWGFEVTVEDRTAKGDGYYIKEVEGEERIYLLRTARPPTTAYYEYHYQHEEFSADLLDADIKFPADARGLSVAYAAEHGKAERWFPRASDKEIEKAVNTWESIARGVARRSRTPRKMKTRPKVGNHYYN
jgi:hypothetical protein